MTKSVEKECSCPMLSCRNPHLPPRRKRWVSNPVIAAQAVLNTLLRFNLFNCLKICVTVSLRQRLHVLCCCIIRLAHLSFASEKDDISEASGIGLIHPSMWKRVQLIPIFILNKALFHLEYILFRSLLPDEMLQH